MKPNNLKKTGAESSIKPMFLKKSILFNTLCNKKINQLNYVNTGINVKGNQ